VRYRGTSRDILLLLLLYNVIIKLVLIVMLTETCISCFNLKVRVFNTKQILCYELFISCKNQTRVFNTKLKLKLPVGVLFRVRINNTSFDGK